MNFANKVPDSISDLAPHSLLFLCHNSQRLLIRLIQIG